MPSQPCISRVLLTKELSEFANCKVCAPEPKVKVDPLFDVYTLPTTSEKPPVLKSPPSKYISLLPIALAIPNFKVPLEIVVFPV